MATTGPEDAEVMYALQRGLPIVRRPFAQVGANLGLTGDDVVARARELLDGGLARRMGAVFDLRRLGYSSVLCAVAVEPDDIEDVAARVTPHAGVTHCYLRTCDPDLDPAPQVVDGIRLPNLWFTLSALGEHFDAELARMRAAVAPRELLALPATARFKINVIFDPRKRHAGEQVPAVASERPGEAHWDGVVRSFSDREKAVIRAMQGNMPICEKPFDAVARQVGMDPDDLVALLADWHAVGILRRVALIARHRRIGFKANGMCTWPAPEDDIMCLGRRLAQHPVVTHCYRRASLPAFPYNLYAMIHTGSWGDTRALFGEISSDLGLDGLVFLSTREFKKTSPRPFSENLD